MLAWSVGIGLVLASAIVSTGEPEELILERIDDTPVALLAPAIGMDVVELVDRLGDEGVVVDDPGMSVRQLADRYRAEADDLWSRCCASLVENTARPRRESPEDA